MSASTERLFITSRLLSAAGVVHGFSLRTGGVSKGAYASLNLGEADGEDPASVRENLSRLAAAAGVRAPFATARQVHGDRVVGAGASGVLKELLPATDPSASTAGGADAVVALDPGVAAGVRVADCVPVLLFAEDAGAVAAVHSGWRGARLSIAGRGVRALQHAAGADPAKILAAIGPCIERCCYEVSPELAAMFRATFGPDVADDPGGQRRPHLDLRAVVERTLQLAGVPTERIEQVGGCTSCDAGAYFSHRRDQGRTGRHLAFVQAPI